LGSIISTDAELYGELSGLLAKEAKMLWQISLTNVSADCLLCKHCDPCHINVTPLPPSKGVIDFCYHQGAHSHCPYQGVLPSLPSSRDTSSLSSQRSTPSQPSLSVTCTCTPLLPFYLLMSRIHINSTITIRILLYIIVQL